MILLRLNLKILFRTQVFLTLKKRKKGERAKKKRKKKKLDYCGGFFKAGKKTTTICHLLQHFL